MKKQRIINNSIMIICTLLLIVSCILLGAVVWYLFVFGNTGFDSVIYTLNNSIGGSDPYFIQSLCIKSIFPTLFISLVISHFIWLFWRKKGLKIIIPIFISLLLCLTISLMAVRFIGLYQWIVNANSTSDIFEKEYVDPKTVDIAFPETQRNLIIIYLESMETSFFDQEKGGALSYNVIPELYDLAKNNTNFSDNDDVGGFFHISGATWTAGAMVSSSSGVPLKVPLFATKEDKDGNELGDYPYFLKGLTGINDLLHEKGYNQYLMIGTNSEFAGTKKYYAQHGVDKIYDMSTIENDGIIPQYYQGWDGVEDQYLYQYAKQELSKIGSESQPFCFTMYTMDTHAPEGYLCSKCENNFQEQYENVLSCSSRQINEFINWLKEQAFFENTTIVVMGDHCSMAQEYFTKKVNSDYERHVYNCFINALEVPTLSKNRVITTFDMFPTILSAMGCKISGNRLGLGINLFSNIPTLAELYGYSYLNNLESQNSDYYNQHFVFQ